MKILLFINSLVGGGAERVTTILSNELVAMGYDVRIFLKEYIVDYELDKRIRIVNSTKFLNYNGSFLLFKLIGLVSSYIKRFIDTKRTIIDFKPDVIVASWGSNLLQILITSGKIPVVASEHNTFDRVHSVREKFNRFYLNKFCTKVVVLTNYDKEFMSRRLRNTQVIYNPLSFEPITEETYINTFDERCNILACGRLNAYYVKGFDNLLRCFSNVSRKYPSWCLDIAGKGDYQSLVYLKKLCKEYEIEDRVHFLGFCNNVKELMLKHSIFVLSSRFEGFGMVLTEAMSMGCPCVSYNLSGPNEIIQHNVDGLLVESQNIEKLSASISMLIENKQMRMILGSNAIQNVRHLTAKNITNQWISLFKSITESIK